jgi:O-methyltransferase
MPSPGDSLINSAVQRRVTRILSKWIVDVPGDTAEVGVFMGGTTRKIADARPHSRHFAFDTWDGSPEPHPKECRWDFKAADLESVKAAVPNENITWVQGVFPDTLTKEHDRQYAFCYFDADHEAPCRAFIDFFWPRLNSGGVLLFDDYCNKTFPGVRKALDDSGLLFIQDPTTAAWAVKP